MCPVGVKEKGSKNNSAFEVLCSSSSTLICSQEMVILEELWHQEQARETCL